MYKLFQTIKEKLLWIDYGQIEGFYAKDEVSLAALLELQVALNIAIAEKQLETVGGCDE